MSTSRFTLRTGLLLTLLLLVGAVFAYQHYQRYSESPGQRVVRKSRQQHLDVFTTSDVTALRRRLFKDSGGLAATTIGPGDGVWQQTNRSRAAAAIGDAKFAYIVLPLEQNYRFYDRTTSLMAARRLAATLRTATGKKVMSPELAQRVLGRRASRLPYAQLATLAHRVGAQVVHVFLALRPVGGALKTARTGMLYVVLTKADGHIVKEFQTSFHDDGTGTWGMHFGKVAARAVAALLGAHQAVASQAVDSGSVPAFPVHLSDIPAVADGPLANAAYLQLLAMLTPRRMSYARRRLFERSLMALDRVDHASSDYKLLTARALLHLYRRPAALKYLAAPTTAAERALRDYANGNYPQLTAQVPKIKAPLLRAMAALEQSDLGYAYNMQPGKNLTNLSAPNAQWLALLFSAQHDDDIWYVPDNLSFFISIDGLFPAFDSAFTNAVKQGSVSGTLNTDGPNYGLLKTIFDRAFAKGGGAGSTDYGPRVKMADIWSLYRNLAVANLLRGLYREGNVYGSYGTARSLASEEAPWLDGNPSFMTLHAQVLYNYAKQVQGEQRVYARKKALKLATQAIAYDGTNDYDTYINRWYARQLRQELPAPQRRSPLPLSICAYEWCDYPSSIAVAADKNDVRALPYVISDFGLFRTAANGQLSAKQINAILASRFDGAPGKIPFIADRQLKAGHEAQAMATLKHAVKAGSTNWAVYKRFGDLKLERGDYAGASAAYLKYPAFSQTKPQDPVAVTNHAFDSGIGLFRHGHYREAAPLLRIAVDLHTGAGAEMAAGKYLAMARGDYLTAIREAYAEARRYNSAAAYRDYLTILHLAGMHDRANAGFKAVAPLFESSKVWDALLVGQRMEKRSFAQMAKWVRTYLSANSALSQNNLSAVYLAEQAVIDRVPSRKAVRILAKIEKAYPYKRYGVPLNRRLLMKGAAVKAAVELPAGYGKRRYTAFLYAYTLLEQKSYAESAAAFLRLSKVFPLLSWQNHATYLLPYYVMAAAGAGQKSSLAVLSKLLPAGSGAHFYDSLARALIAAEQGDSKASRKALLRAYREQPAKWLHPVGSWYELVQTAEWIYRRDGDRQVLNLALEWAKQYQETRPQMAWTYAFQAHYMKDGAKRVRAAAFALYLDPDSRWLQTVPAAVRKKARAWWPAHNPFTLKPGKTQAPKMAS